MIDIVVGIAGVGFLAMVILRELLRKLSNHQARMQIWADIFDRLESYELSEKTPPDGDVEVHYLGENITYHTFKESYE